MRDRTHHTAIRANRLSRRHTRARLEIDGLTFGACLSALARQAFMSLGRNVRSLDDALEGAMLKFEKGLRPECVMERCPVIAATPMPLKEITEVAAAMTRGAKKRCF